MTCKLMLNQAVLDGNGRSNEFFITLRHIVGSEISNRYGNSIFAHHDLVEDMQLAAAENALIALDRFDSSKGTFLSYAYSFIIGAIHTEYCLQIFGLTVYYAKKLQQISDALNEYYNTHDSEQLYARLEKHRIRKRTILYLYSHNKIDNNEAYTCLSALEKYRLKIGSSV